MLRAWAEFLREQTLEFRRLAAQRTDDDERAEAIVNELLRMSRSASLRIANSALL